MTNIEQIIGDIWDIGKSSTISVIEIQKCVQGAWQRQKEGKIKKGKETEGERGERQRSNISKNIGGEISKINYSY